MGAILIQTTTETKWLSKSKAFDTGSYVRVCVHIHMYGPVCVHVCGGQKPPLGVISQAQSIFNFEIGSPTGLELT